MKPSLSSRWVIAVFVTVLAVGIRMGAQSLTYTKGQNVAPAYEGWEQDPDGSKWFVFGYMNRNWVEEIDIAPGPDNTIMPGGPDLGQPTHFLTGRRYGMFILKVPADFGKNKLTWTIVANGTTTAIPFSLHPDYEVSPFVSTASIVGKPGEGDTPPILRFEEKGPSAQGPVGLMTQRTAKVGQPLSLTAIVKDDGIPKPPVSANPLAALFGGTTRPATGEAGRGGAAAAPAPPPAPAFPPAP